jgi:glycosyltransferase involved in cell wall biosynthesis
VTSSALVSIVIPAYNYGRFLEEAIESVLRQDYPDVELIAIDDGSTDETPDVLAKYGRRFHWERQPNSGQARALARGWSLAHGSILGYLSADDILYSQAVSAAVAALLARTDVVLTYGDYDLISPDSIVMRRVRAPELTYSEMVLRHICAPGPGAFFRRSAYEQAGPWNPSFPQTGDFEFWLRLGRLGSFHRIPKSLAGLRVHPASQSFAAMSSERSEESLRAVELLLEDRTLPAEIREEKSVALGHAHLVVARAHLRAARYRVAASHLRQAFRLKPRLLASWSAIHLVINGLANRFVHSATWRIMRLAGNWRASRLQRQRAGSGKQR